MARTLTMFHGDRMTRSTIPQIKPSRKGLLHANLGIKKGTKIPMARLRAAKASKNPAIRKRATFAINARSWGK